MTSKLTQNVSLSGIASSEAFGLPSLVLVPYSETLLAKAQELITKGDFTNFSIAVVVAHMACEISAERAISRAFAEKGIGYLEGSVLAYVSGYNLAAPNHRLRNLYNAQPPKPRNLQHLNERVLIVPGRQASGMPT